MMAAYAAALCGRDVTIFERNEKILKKLYITGKGRCNITNDSDITAFNKNIVRNPKFLFSVFNTFSNTDLIEFLRTNGLPVKTERGGRVFPASDKSSDVIKLFDRVLKQWGVQVKLNTRVESVQMGKSGFIIAANGQTLEFERCIIATGGVSYPATGSTGDGYAFAEQFNVQTKKPLPSLIPLTTDDSALCALSGVCLKNVKFSLYQSNKLKYSEQGEMVLCHFGVSGPIVLSASAYYDHSATDSVGIIDLKPALSEEKLDARILRDFEGQKNKELKNALGELLIQSLIPLVLLKSGIEGNLKVHSLTAKQRLALVKTIKNLEFTITGTRPINEAIITRGGISASEIHPKTMESKKIKGLYFAGEVLDVDALTGGYNLQIAFSTGYAAGASAAI